jgi:tetratricopeptide (TPR) repeat protein
MATYWTRLRGNAAMAAIEDMRREYGRELTASQIMTLGVAYLWVGNYQDAFEHFDCVAQSSPRSSVANPRRSAGFFGMAGAAKWCLGQTDEAINQWRAGLGADYADAAGGIRLPMLLFSASIVKPSIISKEEAAPMLEKKTHDPRVSNWPGPLGQFILGQIDQSTLSGSLVGVHERDTTMRRWLADFYFGIAELEHGNERGFKRAMRQTVESALDESKPERFFTGCLWHEEFFLARNEISSK